MPRLPYAEFPPPLKQRIEQLWGKPPNLYRTLANHPGMLAAWTEFANSIRHDSQTPRAMRELMILRTAQLTRSEYEWAQHLKMARANGVRDAQIAALERWRDSPEFDAREKAALLLTDAVQAIGVSDEVYAEVRKQFSEAEFVELSLTAAFYAMVSRMLDALRVELEPAARDYSPRLP